MNMGPMRIHHTHMLENLGFQYTTDIKEIDDSFVMEFEIENQEYAELLYQRCRGACPHAEITLREGVSSIIKAIARSTNDMHRIWNIVEEGLDCFDFNYCEDESDDEIEDDFDVEACMDEMHRRIQECHMRLPIMLMVA